MVAHIRLTHDETETKPLIPLNVEIKDGYLGHIKVFDIPTSSVGSCKLRSLRNLN